MAEARCDVRRVVGYVVGQYDARCLVQGSRAGGTTHAPRPGRPRGIPGAGGLADRVGHPGRIDERTGHVLGARVRAI